MKKDSASPLKRVVTAVGAVLVVALGAAFAVFSETGDSTEPRAGDLSWPSPVKVEAAFDRATLVCPPGVLDPRGADGDGGEHAQEVSAPGHWPADDLSELRGGGSARLVEIGQGSDSAAMASITVSGAAQGDLASLLVDACQMPARSLGVASGRMGVGEDTLLVLSNPSTEPETVSLRAFTDEGPVPEVPTSVVIPGNTTQTYLPAAWVGEAGSFALEATAQGAGVAGWLQSSSMDGEVPRGLARLPLTAPTRQAVLIGLDPRNAGTLRIANLDDTSGVVAISVTGEDGLQALGGAEEVRVPADGLVEVDLGTLPDEARGVVLEADVRVTASIQATVEGKKHPDQPEQKVASRTLISGTQPLSSAAIPPAAALMEAAKDLKLKDVEVHLVVANTQVDSVDVTAGSRSMTIPSGAAIEFPLAEVAEEGASELVADEPVHAALVVAATSTLGKVRAVSAVGAEDAASQSVWVSLLPDHG